MVEWLKWLGAVANGCIRSRCLTHLYSHTGCSQRQRQQPFYLQHRLYPMVDTAEWAVFDYNSITAEFSTDNSAAGTLPEFVSAELARLSQGCARDGNRLAAGSATFHPARQVNPGTRKITCVHGLHVINDMVCVLVSPHHSILTYNSY